MTDIVLRAGDDFGPDFCFSGPEGDLEVELLVDGCLLGRLGVADDVTQVAEGSDEGPDVVAWPRGRSVSQPADTPLSRARSGELDRRAAGRGGWATCWRSPPGFRARRHDGRVAESLETQFLHADREVECPACQYPVWVIWAEIAAQAVILSPCCRIRTYLVDSEGSAQDAARSVERRVSQFLKGFRL